LNNKQEAFIREYLIDFNATQAAIRAGYSKRTAGVIGCENLTKPNISEAIKKHISEKTMTSDEVLTRLADMGRGNLADLMDVTTSGFTIELMKKDEAGNLIVKPETKLIKKIKQKVTTYLAKKESEEDREIVETEIELYSAQEALNTIAKLNGMITDKLDLTTKGDKILPDDRFDRALSTLAATLREIVPGENTKQNSEMGATE
jgi:phage terminase small subunit